MAVRYLLASQADPFLCQRDNILAAAGIMLSNFLVHEARQPGMNKPDS